MTSAPNCSSSSFPRRRATSSERSFSMKPVGPMVPVSCPPWPGSMTMRLTLSPSARGPADVHHEAKRIGQGKDRIVFGAGDLEHDARDPRAVLGHADAVEQAV